MLRFLLSLAIVVFTFSRLIQDGFTKMIALFTTFMLLLLFFGDFSLFQIINQTALMMIVSFLAIYIFLEDAKSGKKLNLPEIPKIQ